MRGDASPIGKSGLLVAQGLLVSLFAGPQLALSQESSGIEEIIVSAQRRDERTDDVPISITAFSEEDIARFNLQEVRDIAAQTPNFRVDQLHGVGEPDFVVRGVQSIDWSGIANSSVVVYSDGVTLNSGYDQGFALFDLERIEVLRGPQGTFFGRNATSGAVQVVSNQPTEETTGRVSVTMGDYGKQRYEASVSGSVAAGILGRLAVLKETADGYIENEFLGDELPKQDTLAVRGILSTASDSFSASLKVQYADTDGSNVAIHNGLFPTHPVTGEPGGKDSDFRKIWINLEQPERNEVVLSALTADWTLGSTTLTSVTGYSQHDYESLIDDDSSSATLLQETFKDDQWQFTQELRLASDTQGQLDWIVGAYIMKERVDNQYVAEFTDLFGIPGTGVSQGTGNEQNLVSYAAFAETDWQFTEEWSLKAGLRWTEDNRHLTQDIRPCNTFDPATTDFTHIDASVPLIFPAFGCPEPAVVHLDESWSSPSGRLIATFKPNENALIYGGYTRGFKGGTFTGTSASLGAALSGIVDPETLDSFEIGYKANWFERRLVVESAAFYYIYKDKQQYVTQPDPTVAVGFVQALDNLPEAALYGVEVSVTAIPIDNLTVNFGAGILQSEFKDSVLIGGNDFQSGDDMPYVEDYNLNGSIEYRIGAGSWGSIVPQVDGNYVGNYDTGGTHAGGYGNLNVRLALLDPSERFRVTAFVQNATDEVQVTRRAIGSFNATLGSDITYVNAPRTWGVTLSGTL